MGKKMRVDKKWRLLFSYLKRYRVWGVLGSIFMLLNVLMLIPTPLLTVYLIDTVLPAGDMKNLGVICMLCLGILLANGCFRLLQTLFFSKFNAKLVFDIRMDMIRNLQRTSSQYRQSQQTGYLLSRINEDPDRLQSLFADTFASLVKDIIILLIGIALIFSLHWKMALMVLILLPFFIFSLNYFGFQIRQISSVFYEYGALFLKKLQESISLMDTFILFRAEKSDQIRLVREQKAIVRTQVKKNMIQGFASVVVAIIGGVAPVLVLWFGISEIIQGHLSLGKLIAFNTFIAYVFGPTSRLINTAINMQESLAAWDRIYEILSDLPLLLRHSKNARKQKLEGSLVAENLNFGYQDKDVLKNINFYIPPKQTVAIVGESGSGKSSLLSLLTKMNFAREACVRVDGTYIEDISDYLCQIALVQQEPSLISTSILENIRLGNSSASFEEIVQAAKQAQIHDFIDSLPLKYDTLLDERGCNMSVGQKQRIAIARCIVRNPVLFFMDEATAGLDATTEKSLLYDLRDFIKSRTTLMVAHRLSSIAYADRIIVLNKGEIVEDGDMETLLSQNGFFANLWKHQSTKHETL